MKKLLSRIVILIVVLAAAFAANELYFKKPKADASAKSVSVTAEMDVRDIAAALKEAGIISSAALFDAASGLTGSFKNFHAGTFIFKQGMSIADALKTLSFAGRQEITVTVPEGWKIDEIADKLASAGVLKSREEFFAVSGEPGKSADIPAAVMADLPALASRPKTANLEGYLFPDTYRFYAAASPAEVAAKMVANFEEQTKSLWTLDALRGRSVHEILTVASLLEAEVKDEADRAKVADIIRRRLDAGIPLQFDSTVNYVTGKNTPAISAADQATDSPYNTYKYKGLPPGPIGNPGLSSIRAALAPAPNKFWYFLTASDGTVIYSTTLDEHNTAKAKYLR